MSPKCPKDSKMLICQKVIWADFRNVEKVKIFGWYFYDTGDREDLFDTKACSHE